MKVVNLVFLYILSLFLSCNGNTSVDRISSKEVIQSDPVPNDTISLEKKFSIDKKSIIVESREQVDLAMRELMLLNGYDMTDFRNYTQIESGKSVSGDGSYFIGSLICEDILNIRMSIVEIEKNFYSIHVFSDRRRNGEYKTLNWEHSDLPIISIARGIDKENLDEAMNEVLVHYKLTMKNLEDENEYLVSDLYRKDTFRMKEMQFVKTTTALLLLYKLPSGEYKVEFMTK